jgi:hypothetical protein
VVNGVKDFIAVYSEKLTKPINTKMHNAELWMVKIQSTGQDKITAVRWLLLCGAGGIFTTKWTRGVPIGGEYDALDTLLLTD